MKIICFGVSVLLFFGRVMAPAGEDRASRPELSAPQEPYVGKVPERGKWAMHLVQTGSPSDDGDSGIAEWEQANSSRPVRIECLTWNDVKRDVFTRADGTTETIFYYAGYVLVPGQSSDGRPAPVLVRLLPGTDYVTLRSGSWMGLEWIGTQFYQGPELYRSHLRQDAEPVLCYFYKKPEGYVANSDVWMPELRAWIRADDLQPMAVGIGRDLFEFTRLDPPTSPPEMSQEQAARLLDLRAQNESMERLRERNRRLRGE